MHAFIIEGNNEEQIESEINILKSKNNAQRINFSLQKVDDASALSNFVKFSYADCKLIVIKNLETASLETKSAILKTLEEPPENILYIIVTKSIYLIPETITSRCQIVKLSKSGAVKTQQEYDIKKFLSLSQGSKLSFISKITKRDDAILFLESVTIHCHQLLLTSPQKDEFAKVVLNSEVATASLKANGNAILQLTNFVANLEQ